MEPIASSRRRTKRHLSGEFGTREQAATQKVLMAAAVGKA